MKKTAVIGLSVAIIIACGLLLGHLAKVSDERDRVFRQRLAGVWLRAEDNLPPVVGGAQSMRCTNIVAADGSFVELSWFSRPHRTNTYQRTGTWLVKNSRLIETVKTSTNPVEVTPHSIAGRIVRADEGGFTLRWQNSEETIWQRVTQ